MTNSNTKAYLYVMSGTGNTFRMANWVKDTVEPKKIKTKIIMIDDKKSRSFPKFNSNNLVGVLFPAHGLMAPWSMIKFLLRMPRGKGAKLFSAATRGGIPIGKLIIPGAAGLGNYMAAMILLLKGYKIKALFSIDMPINFMNIFWGPHPKNIKKVSEKAIKKTESAMTKIINGKSIFFTRNNLWEAIWGFGFLWLVPVFPLIYLLIGRIYMGKMLFSNYNCVSCGLCARFCPNDAIIMKPVSGKERPFWTYHCEACLRCMGFCNKRAIEAGHSWGIILYFITAIPVITWLIKLVNESYSLIPEIQNYWINQLINVIYVLPAMIIAYWIFWNLIRIPVINKIFTFTTLTHVYRRYHEPKTRLKDLK